MTPDTSEQRIVHIRKSIELAQENEEKSHSLQKYLEEQLPALHHTISLTPDNGIELLLDFVTRYIEHVPDFLEAIAELARSAGIYECTKQFLTIAEDFFISPPKLLEDRAGMQALIDEAYLAHRLIEEINDRVMMACNVPLTPMDMTLSNIIIHSLLGDEYANQLDLAVHYSIESLFKVEDFTDNPSFKAYIAFHKTQGWSNTLNNWPCLAGDSSLSLNFENALVKSIVH